jgi:hypothetical protein
VFDRIRKSADLFRKRIVQHFEGIRHFTKASNTVFHLKNNKYEVFSTNKKGIKQGLDLKRTHYRSLKANESKLLKVPEHGAWIGTYKRYDLSKGSDQDLRLLKKSSCYSALGIVVQ